MSTLDPELEDAARRFRRLPLAPLLGMTAIVAILLAFVMIAAQWSALPGSEHLLVAP